jgi:hypothetical protein
MIGAGRISQPDVEKPDYCGAKLVVLHCRSALLSLRWHTVTTARRISASGFGCCLLERDGLYVASDPLGCQPEDLSDTSSK